MIIEQAAKVLKTEAESISELIGKLDDNFTKMVNLILESRGRLVIGGIGKSGLIGKKIVATLNSTGTNSVFIHPVEAMHGDLGMVTKDDIFIALSNSGETSELNILVPNIIKAGCSTIAFTGNPGSTLAKLCNITIDVGVSQEACAMGLVPTSSTTALLAMGDALAVVLMNKKNFKSMDFKKFHPGGNLGQRLSKSASHIMLPASSVPLVNKTATIEKSIQIMDKYKLGLVVVVNEENKITGVLSDGDLRHIIAQNTLDISKPVETIMTKSPKTVLYSMPLYDVLNIMENHQITVLPVTNEAIEIQGIIHLHDILGKGAFKFSA